MEKQKIISTGKTLNIIVIVMTLAVFILSHLGSLTTYMTGQTSTYLTIMIAVVWIWRVISVVGFVISLVLNSKKTEPINGLGLLIASYAVSMAFSILGFMLGIIIWILSGMSISKLKAAA